MVPIAGNGLLLELLVGIVVDEVIEDCELVLGHDICVGILIDLFPYSFDGSIQDLQYRGLDGVISIASYFECSLNVEGRCIDALSAWDHCTGAVWDPPCETRAGVGVDRVKRPRLWRGLSGRPHVDFIAEWSYANAIFVYWNRVREGKGKEKA